MWNVEEHFSPKAIESLAALGFAVGSTRGVVRVEKYGCGAEFRKGPDDLYEMTVTPTIMLKGRFTRLWDAGYQKFLLTDDGQKLPALATHLQNLRKFNEELRTALGVPTFYNEALGSVSQVSVYDRGRARRNRRRTRGRRRPLGSTIFCHQSSADDFSLPRHLEAAAGTAPDPHDASPLSAGR